LGRGDHRRRNGARRERRGDVSAGGAGGAGGRLPDTGDDRSWRAMLAALRVPAFAWYWAGQLLSGIGTWSQSIALSWLVLDLTHSAVDLGTITMLQFLPVLVLSLLGGVVADRVPRRQLLVATQVALGVEAITLGVLVASHAVTLWEVAFVALAVGTTNALNNPAQQAFVPELVGRDLVADAVALNSVQFNAARMLGGAVGGLAIAAWGISGALFLNAASFAPILVVLVLIRPANTPRRHVGARATAASELREGLAFALETTPVRRVVLLFAIVGLLGFNWQVAVPLVARFVLHRQAAGFGDLMAALGAALVALGLSRSYPASLAILAAAGIAGVVASITANTRLQLLTPDRLRGRVMGIYVLLMGGTTPIGSLLLGEVAGHFGTGVALVAFGGTTAAAVGLVGALRHRTTRSSGEPAPTVVR
jgi:MFS family permease